MYSELEKNYSDVFNVDSVSVSQRLRVCLFSKWEVAKNLHLKQTRDAEITLIIAHTKKIVLILKMKEENSFK